MLSYYAEYIISVAATLCMQALENGCSAGFAANMPVGKDTTPAFLPPGSGVETREKLLSAFARLKTVRALSFTTFLDTLNACTDLTMIVLSCYDSEEIQLRLPGEDAPARTHTARWAVCMRP